jgi:hypothetical protein
MDSLCFLLILVDIIMIDRISIMNSVGPQIQTYPMIDRISIMNSFKT